MHTDKNANFNANFMHTHGMYKYQRDVFKDYFS